MAYNLPIPGDLSISGGLRVTGAITPAKAKSDILAVAELQKFPIPLTDFKVWNDMAANLPTAGATDDLGLVEGTYATATPSLQTEDLKAAGATNNYARVLVQLPWEYEAAMTVILRFKAGMITTVADATATLDCQAFKLQDDPDDAIGSDLVTTSATTINSTTFADINFTVTATGLIAGDILDIRITTAVNDAATETAVIAGITSAKLVCDVR
jgi:hypothetical protein